MSAFGWCWRCAERENARYGVDTGRDEGPLCDRCKVERDEYHALFTPPPVLPPAAYAPVTRVRTWGRGRWVRR